MTTHYLIQYPQILGHTVKSQHASGDKISESVIEFMCSLLSMMQNSLLNVAWRKAHSRDRQPYRDNLETLL